MKIKVTLQVEGKTETVTEIDSHILNHIFVAHSLNLHNWAKQSKEKLQKKIESLTMASQREDGVREIEFYFDDLEGIEERRKQADTLEKAFKELTTYL